MEECRSVLVVASQSGRDPDAHSYGKGRPGVGTEYRRLDFCAKLIRRLQRYCDACLRQHQRKLVPAVAHQNIALAGLFFQNACDLSQHRIAPMMAILIIDLLEIVDVDHHQRQRPAISFGPLEFMSQPLFEHSLVVEAGQRIFGRPLFHVAALMNQLLTHADPSRKVGKVKGLDNVIVCAQFQPSHPLLCASQGGQEDNINIGLPRIFADLPADFQAAHFGHHDVQQGYVYWLLGKLLHSLFAIGRDHHPIAVLAQNGLDDLQLIRVVLRNQNGDRPLLDFRTRTFDAACRDVGFRSNCG